jgi:hypothetical protein
MEAGRISRRFLLVNPDARERRVRIGISHGRTDDYEDAESTSENSCIKGEVAVKNVRVPGIVLRIVLLGMAMSAASTAHADAVFTVDTIVDQLDVDTSDGLCRTISNTCSLRAATMQANHAIGAGVALIYVPAGTYLLTRPPIGADGEDDGDLNLAMPLSADQTIIIIGAGAADTIIDANQADRALRVDFDRVANIAGITIRNGYAADGGGISNSGTLTISHSVIENNRAEYNGGGITNAFGTLTVVRSTIRSNVARIEGGGMNLSGPTTIHDSTLYGNGADNGGGIRNSDQLRIVNSTISYNFAYTDGGGINNQNNTELFSTTVVGNDADHDHDENGGIGGGVFNAAGSRFVVVNTLIADNTQYDSPIYNDCGGTLEAYGWNLFYDLAGCNIPNFVSVGLVSPSTISPLQDNGGPTLTHALLPGSEAIDTSHDDLGCVDENWDPLTTEQRGGARVAGVRCDVGAFEHGATIDQIFGNGFDWTDATHAPKEIR